MKAFVVCAGLLLLAGCSNLSGTKTLGSDINVGYTLDPKSGNIAYFISSNTCGVVTQGTAHVEAPIAACVAVKAGTSLVGTVATPSAPLAP
jgi:catabolite regulation protein CreA